MPSKKNCHSRNCYTYRIGWSKLNINYYGSRYAKGCDPSDFWVTYYTSSTLVKRMTSQHGEPDIKEIRRVFGNNPKETVS